MFIFFSSCEKTYLYKISSKETTDIYVSDKVLSEEEKQEVLLNYESYLKKNNYCKDLNINIKLLHRVNYDYTFYVLPREKQ